MFDILFEENEIWALGISTGDNRKQESKNEAPF
jgi:hypothetical protein